AGDENVTLPYWLSNASALLCLLQRNLRSNDFLTTTQRSAGSSGLISRVGHVAEALFEITLTRFSGDILPATDAGI
ncbi:myosin-15 isoform X3, partial [Fagus crenata]